MKNSINVPLVRLFGLIALVAVTGFTMTVCSSPTGGETTLAPIEGDYTFGNLEQTAGSVIAVTITAKNGRSNGAITIYYEGTGDTTYTKSTEVPQAAGTYAVTFDVAAAEGWKAVTGLSAGNLTINPRDSTNPFAGTTWTGMDWEDDECEMAFTATDWTLTYPDNSSVTGTYTYDGNTATLSHEGEILGTAAISGNTLTVDIDEAGEITFTRKSSPGDNQTPVAEDYTFDNMTQTEGNVTAVTITPKDGKSPGVVGNIRYDGNTEIPQTVGTYAVTFDVAAAEGWNTATSLSAGNLRVNPEGSGSNEDGLTPETAITLTVNQWESGTVATASSVVWYKFDVSNGTTYRVWWNDRYEGPTPKDKTGDVVVGAQYAGSSTWIFGGTDTSVDSGWTTPRSFNATQTGTVYVRVSPYIGTSTTYTGTFGIVYSTGSTRPDTTNVVNQTPVASDYTFGNMTQTAGSVTAVTIAPNSGKSSGARTLYYEGTGGTTYTKSTTPPQTVGTYAVTFDVAATTGWNVASNLSAGTLTVNPEGSGSNEDGLSQETAITLTEDLWENGTVATASSVVWYKFNVTSGTTYRVWWNDEDDGPTPKDKTGDVVVGAQYEGSSSWIFGGTDTSVDSGWTTPRTISAFQTGTVYVRVRPYGSSFTGTFAIVYSTGSDRPDVPPSVTSVTLNKNSLTLTAGGTETLTPTVLPANAANKNVTWSTSDSAVATVNNGTVTAVAVGTTTITVTTADGGKTAQCTVTVEGAPPLSGTVSITGLRTVPGPRQVTILMRSSIEGEGWSDSAALRVNVNGTNLSTNAQIASGDTGTYTFSVNEGDVVQFYWVRGGRYDRYCAFAVYYSDDPPSPAFEPWVGSAVSSAVLVYQLLRAEGSAAFGNGTPMGSFTAAGSQTQTQTLIMPLAGEPVFRGETLTAGIGDLGGSGAISYQWNRGITEASTTAIPGANSSTYTVQAADLSFVITVTVTRAENTGSVTSPATGTGTNPTPVASDYNFGNMSQWVGSITAVTITPKSGKSPGAVSNIRYDGNTAIPQTAGTYAVTFDVAAATGWNVATGLSAGNLTVNLPETPVASDYTFGNMSQWVGSITAVTITVKNGKSPGAVSNIRYAGNTAVPQAAGTYAVTFDVAAVPGWNGATGLSAGNLTIDLPKTPVASDYTFVDMNQWVGSVAAVTITVKSGKSPGTVSNIRYAGNTAIPQTVGTYAVTFDVAAVPGWNGATGLSAGNLVVFDPKIDWKAVTSSFGSTNIYSVAYGGGKWVAGGSSGKTAYSTDGINWEAIEKWSSNEIGTTITIESLGYGNGRWVAVGSAGKMYSTTSINGPYVSWGEVTNSTFGTSEITGVAYGNYEWVAGGGSGKMAYSTNGTTWTAVTNSTFGTSYIYGVAYDGNGRWVAVGGSGCKMAYSTNGTTWYGISFGAVNNQAFYDVAYGNGKWVAVGTSVTAYSTDGRTFTRPDISGPLDTFAATSVAYGGATGKEKFVAVGSNGKMAYSRDGITWIEVTDNTFGTSNIRSIAYSGGRWVAVGDNGKMAYADD